MHPVVALGFREGRIDDIEIIKGMPQLEDVHTISLYLGAAKQKEYYNYLLELNPQRIIFNPGTHNPGFRKMAEAKGIETVESCMLIMLELGEF